MGREPLGMGRGVGPGEQVTEQTCDRCDKPMDPEDERECEACCQVLCSRCMYDDTLCNDCEASQEEEAAFPEELEP